MDTSGAAGKHPETSVVWSMPPVIRPDEPFVADEHAMLDGFLDRSRSARLERCVGLIGEQLARQVAPPSNLSLLGLIRHVTDPAIED
ncbi:MAG TPA: DUF664 domain-containing protein [Chloroflexota bacterium]|nr:DUF664 domain-containing protein [Chloroflexota bacterium]